MVDVHRPKLFLDVDGVVNGISHRAMSREWSDCSRHTFGLYKANLSAEMGEMLSMIDADIVWLTTWQETASAGLGPAIRINAPYVDWFDEFYVPGLPTVTGKARGMAKWLRDNSVPDSTPVLWVDDELLASNPGISARGLSYLSPKPRTGLTRADVLTIEEWAVSVA